MTLVKTLEGYVVIVPHTDDTTNVYRFKTKREAMKWMRQAGGK